MLCLYFFGTLHHEGTRHAARLLVDAAAVGALLLFVGEAYIAGLRPRLRNIQAYAVLLLGLSGAIFVTGGFLIDRFPSAPPRLLGLKLQSVWLAVTPLIGGLVTAVAWPRLNLVARDILSRALLIVMPLDPILARWLGAWRIEGLP